jgi:two-component system sensor histidine kinase YesM
MTVGVIMVPMVTPASLGLARRLNDLKLRDKMVLSFLLFMLVPQVFIGFLMVREFRQSTLEEALDQSARGVSRLQHQALDILNVGLTIGDRLSVAGDVETLLTTKYASSLDVFSAYHGFETFQLYTEMTPEVSSIQAYAENPTLIDNWQIRPATDAVQATFWYDAARKHPNISGWFSWSDETKDPASRLSLVRYVPFFAKHQGAVLVVNLNTSRLDSLLGQEGIETLVLDPNLFVVASSRQGLAGQPLADPRLLALIASPSPSTYVREIDSSSTFNRLKIVSIVSPEVVLRPADRIIVPGVVLIALGALLSLGFLWMVYTLFTRRLEVLSRRLPLVAAGDFDQVLSVGGNDEIGQLAAQFNAMVLDIRKLMNEVKAGHEIQSRLVRAQGEIRLKMLASQINPHFLFNVLESIRMKAHLKGEPEIANTVKLLGRLMRRNLEAGGQPIPLVEEFENVRYYLEIEKFRLEEKLEYTLDAGPGTGSLLVPPLIVEPLVENAVVHGLEGQFGGGKVTVTARLAGNRLVVSVADNGLGITEARRALLLSGPEGHHVGLKNIHQRLGLTYGPDVGLTIESAEGKGTTVSFQIPLDRRP